MAEQSIRFRISQTGNISQINNKVLLKFAERPAHRLMRGNRKKAESIGSRSAEITGRIGRNPKRFPKLARKNFSFQFESIKQQPSILSD